MEKYVYLLFKFCKQKNSKKKQLPVKHDNVFSSFLVHRKIHLLLENMTGLVRQQFSSFVLIFRMPIYVNQPSVFLLVLLLCDHSSALRRALMQIHVNKKMMPK